jgi:hypothetical protein
MIKIVGLFNGCRFLTEEENLDENLKIIQEMGATLRKKESGLPANLFLDDAKTWSQSGHGRRIKFQPNTGDHPNTRNMIPMSIDDDPQILTKNARISLNAKQIGQIKAFVQANKEQLLLLSDAKISFIDFWKQMKKV